MFDEILSSILSLITNTLIIISSATLLIVFLFCLHDSLRNGKSNGNIPYLRTRPVFSYWQWLTRLCKQKSIRACKFYHFLCVCILHCLKHNIPLIINKNTIFIILFLFSEHVVCKESILICDILIHL